MSVSPLTGLRVVSLAPHLPGPLAAARLRSQGAEVTKVEPPWGDALERWAPGWYRELHRGTRVERWNLKSSEGRERLAALLAEADLLLTATRPGARARLGIDEEGLRHRHPRLCSVAIVGSEEDPERPGHDLTYQAAAGLVTPPEPPRALLADVLAGERAATAALALLLSRERGGEAREVRVSIQEAARAAAASLVHGLTVEGGVLGGGSARYGIYRARDGWVAVAALEDHFWARLREEVLRLAESDGGAWTAEGGVASRPERAGVGAREPGGPAGEGGSGGSRVLPAEDDVAVGAVPRTADGEPDLLRIFPLRSPAWWEAWARERDLPIVAVPRQW